MNLGGWAIRVYAHIAILLDGNYVTLSVAFDVKPITVTIVVEPEPVTITIIAESKLIGQRAAGNRYCAVLNM
jgi:hypothetical protein